MNTTNGSPENSTEVNIDVQQFVNLLPAHKCGLHLTHNPHREYYDSAKQHIAKNSYGWKGEEAKARAIATDEIWELQWYPDTPVAFYIVYAPTLLELLELARSIEKENNEHHCSAEDQALNNTENSEPKHDGSKNEGCSSASHPVLNELSTWLEGQIQEYKEGALMTIADSAHGQSTLMKVLEKVKEIQAQGG